MVAVWSRSLPAFHWQVHNTDSQYARVRHSCNVAGNRQMLVVGGQVSDAESTLDALIRDPWPQGVGVYDLAALSWSDSFDADAEPYVTPDVIKANYEANGMFPSAWTESDVSGWFAQPNERQTGTSSAPANDEGQRGKSPAGAIAGGVVGGLAALAIIARIVWYLRRRSRRRDVEYSVAAQHTDDLKTHIVSDQYAREEIDGRPWAELHGKERPVEIGTSPIHVKERPVEIGPSQINERYCLKTRVQFTFSVSEV